ncbi:MAG: hypothetical protein V7785_22135 [Bermanella sp.]
MRNPKDLNTDKAKKAGNLVKPIIFLLIFTGIMSLAAYSFLTYNPEPIAQKFFENRKMGKDYQDYKDEDSAKKKAERNIFLQN